MKDNNQLTLSDWSIMIVYHGVCIHQCTIAIGQQPIGFLVCIWLLLHSLIHHYHNTKYKYSQSKHQSTRHHVYSVVLYPTICISIKEKLFQKRPIPLMHLISNWCFLNTTTIILSLKLTDGWGAVVFLADSMMMYDAFTQNSKIIL